MRTFQKCATAIAATMVLIPVASIACEVEDWRWYHTKALKVMGVEGVATCDGGRVTLHAHDQKGDAREFLGVARATIEGGIFKANIFAIDPRPTNPVLEFMVIPDAE